MTGGISKQEQTSLEITRGHSRAQKNGSLYVFKDGETQKISWRHLAILDEILDTLW